MQFSDPDCVRIDPAWEISTTGEILAQAATRFPDKTGFICGERQWRFDEMDRAANRFANFLMSEYSGKDGAIAIISHNCAEYVVTMFGTARAGRVLVNLHTRNTPVDLAAAISLTKPVVLVIDNASQAMAAEALSGVVEAPDILSIRGGDPACDDGFWQRFSAAPDTLPAIDIDPDAPGSVIFTGGTTGKPKAVVASQRARAISVTAAMEDFRLQAEETGGYSVPLTHAAGAFSWFQPAVLAGCTGVMIPKWDVESFQALTETHQISVIFAVPAQLALMLAHPSFDPARLKSLKRIVFGGAPLSRSLIERAETALPWLSCERAFGSSETGHLGAQDRAGRAKIYDGYNQPSGRLEIEIFKEPGVPAAIGEIGEIATRGPHLMSGYLENPDADTEFFRTADTAGDWGWMGDLAMKHDGYYSIVGRSKHIILSGGYNIYPAELEEILNNHSDVNDSAVVGIEDETWGELPVAAIVPARPGIDTDVLSDHVAAKVAGFKRPRQIMIVDVIPRTQSGKIDVDAVKSLF